MVMDSRNLLLAAALSGLALTASAADHHSESNSKKNTMKTINGECHGINSCKGTSSCHSEKNSCAGANTCKGKGWLKTSEKECHTKKGTFKKS